MKYNVPILKHAVKAVLKGSIIINVKIKKEERLQINKLHLKEPEKEQTKPKVRRSEEIRLGEI